MRRRLRGVGDDRSGGRGGCHLPDRRPRHGDADVRRVHRRARDCERTGVPDAREDELRGGGRLAGRLPDGLHHDDLHGQPAPGVERGHSFGGGRRRTRRHPDRQDARVHDLRHRITVEARLLAKPGRRAPDRLQRGLRGGGSGRGRRSGRRPDSRSCRRQVVVDRLRPPRAVRSPGRVRTVVGDLGNEAQPAPRRGAGPPDQEGQPHAAHGRQ